MSETDARVLAKLEEILRVVREILLSLRLAQQHFGVGRGGIPRDLPPKGG